MVADVRALGLGDWTTKSQFRSPLWLSDHELLAQVTCANGAIDHAYRLDLRAGRAPTLTGLTRALGHAKASGWMLSRDRKWVIWQDHAVDAARTVTATTLDGTRSRRLAHWPESPGVWLDERLDAVGIARLETRAWAARTRQLASNAKLVHLPRGWRAKHVLLAPNGKTLAWTLQAANRRTMAKIGAEAIWLSRRDGSAMRLLSLLPNPNSTLELHCYTPDGRRLLATVDDVLYSVPTR